MKQPTAPHVAIALSALSVLAYGSFWLTRGGPSEVRLSPGPGDAPAAQLVQPVASGTKEPGPARSIAGAAPARVPTGAEPLGEAELLTELRKLRVSAPERALARAREANALHPDGPGAAERTWIIVRSLEDLGRFQEARDEALVMRERFPGTSWTSDVERHVLVYPLGQPSREAQQAALLNDPPSSP
ncbi:MAG: hypothetical protein EOO73_02140 [Myxococcales bacterium]|nr:MAG: hypothetical protein EOO73_02140 [Myxococcales bacterium]